MYREQHHVDELESYGCVPEKCCPGFVYRQDGTNELSSNSYSSMKTEFCKAVYETDIIRLYEGSEAGLTVRIL